MYRTLFAAILAALFINVFSQHDIKTLLPGDNPTGNWLQKDSAKVYSGDDLFYLINGGADVYLEYGFNQVAVARYQNPLANKIHVEIYEMEDMGGAFGIFSLNSLGTGKNQDFGDLSFLYDYNIDIWKGRCLIRATVARKDQGVMDTLLIFARAIDQKIESSGDLPKILQTIDFVDKDFYQVKYFRGQIALSNIFNFGHGSIAAFDEGVTGRIEDNAVFVFAYKDDWNRREWFASANGKMQMSRFFSDFEVAEDGFTVSDRAGNPLSFKPYKRFIMVVKGYGWEQAAPYFETIMTNIDSHYQE
jgi:hypothetical protein